MLLRRTFRLEVRASEPGQPVRVVVSTDTPVARYGYLEILDHAAAAVVLAANSVLRNHNSDWVVGKVVDAQLVDGHRIEAGIVFAPTDLGAEEEKLVRGGFVVGISAGYSIEEFTTTDRADGQVEVRATKWTWREMSTTPIPADLAAGVIRSDDDAGWLRALGLPDRSAALATRSASTRSNSPTAASAAKEPAVKMTAAHLRTLLVTYAALAVAISERADAGATYEEVDAWAKAEMAKREASPEARALAEANARAAAAELRQELDRLARSHGVEFSDADLAGLTSREAGLDLILARKAEAETTQPKPQAAGRSTITVGAEDGEKRVDAAIAALIGGRRLSDTLRTFAIGRGQSADGSTDDVIEAVRQRFARLDTRGMILDGGKLNYRAVLVSGDFGSITVLAAAKAMHDGYKAYAPEYPKFAREYFVPDFNTVSISGLGLSELSAPEEEGDAYDDSTLEISGGTGSNEFLGTNIEVSLASIYNDRLGIILGSMGDLGRTGARTLDKIAMAALEAANFTNATTALAFSEANLATAWGGHAGVTIPGIPAKRILVPMPLFVGASNAVTPANGATAGRVLANGNDALQVVKGWYLTDPTDWYLLPDPADAPTVAILRNPDYQAPRLVAKGEGGGATVPFRVDFPAKALVLNRSANKPLCAYKLTVADGG